MKTQVTTRNTFSANRSTEITVWTLGMIVLAILLLTVNASAMTLNFEEEAYIDDIPFDTEMVVKEMMMPEYNFKEEAYINDIPFNTSTIASRALYNKSLTASFEAAEELYVDDIPFSTELIVLNYNYQAAVSFEYLMPEESYVDDIPFNTCKIAAEMNNNNELYACTN